MIPTYEVGTPEKNPIFLEKRVYQGSSGVVYPYPVIESISDEKVDKTYNAVWLENEYIKVMILPELGGRVQMAYDKLKERHFVYYNHVIKPALVGLLGPWISGGIEFNWPQHHRPTTYMPADCTIEEKEDGSVTVWVSEMEQMFHQKGMAGFTLRPGCAYLEIHGVLYNRTDVPQTFLWWANPAVEVNDAYQSVFPPDVNAVFDHGKRAVSSFPIATGTYYKMDYSAGVDISNYKNIKVPTSYMAVNSKYNFEGGYENDTQAGMLHVASHHFSPGKKQWTWGNGDFGRAWDRNLTDKGPSPLPLPKGRGVDTSEAGETNLLSNYAPPLQGGDGGGSLFRPYIELMAGVYTENQPDFSWLMPYEEKQFTQYFMPYRELGVVKEASKDLILNINSVDNGKVEFKVFATSKQDVRIVLKSDEGRVLYDQPHTLTPENVLTEVVESENVFVKPNEQNETCFNFVMARKGGMKTNVPLSAIELCIFKEEYGKERCVLRWHAESDEVRPIPDSAEAALLPEEIKTNEQLYLTGLHLEQYRHATWSPLDYYEEALRRDPNDIRCLNAMGLWYIRKGRFDKAEDYLRKAVKLSQKRNPNPYDSEPIYNLGLALKYQGQFLAAYELFWKATWSKAWADAGYFEAAKISLRQGRLDDALDELNRCLVYGAHNQKALALKAAVLRHMGKTDEALDVCRTALESDLFNYGCRYEQYLLTGKKDLLDELRTLWQGLTKNYEETALDYYAAGLYEEAEGILQLAIEDKVASPMTYYYLGNYAEAEKADARYCFPNRLEDVIVLSAAKRKHQQGSKAPYYLGCLYYAARQYDLAIENWELSAQLDGSFPTVWRNLALARFNKQGKEHDALAYMEKAFVLDTTDARIFMELDQLRKRLSMSPQKRLYYFDRYPELVARRDDLILERATLLNQLKRYEEAQQLIDNHVFHPWEGGEGKVSLQYQVCRLEQAKQIISKIQQEDDAYKEQHKNDSIKSVSSKGREDLRRAVQLLEECLQFPENLGEGKLYGAQDNDFYYFLGRAYLMLAEKESEYQKTILPYVTLEKKAQEMWTLGTQGPTEPAAAMYYNDAKPDKIYYAGLCYKALGQQDRANGLFYKLINYGKQHLFDQVRMDYFAVSLPDLLIWEGNLQEQNTIHCKYMLALGYAGLNDKERSERYLSEIKSQENHPGIQAFITSLCIPQRGILESRQ